MYISVADGKIRKFCSSGKQIKELFLNNFDFWYNIEKKNTPQKGFENAACGVANPRVRRWAFPRAAFAIPARGVFESRERAFSP